MKWLVEDYKTKLTWSESEPEKPLQNGMTFPLYYEEKQHIQASV
jgi:hypothetical protein